MKIFDNLLDKLWTASRSVGAVRVLVAVSFTEAVFFPVPPDLLLIPIVLATPKNAFKMAFICLVSSVLGAGVGYLVGKFFMSIIGMPIINFYSLQEQYISVQKLYEEYSVLAVAAAALTPIPFKLCTITAGAFGINFPVFLVISFFSRGLRFFVIAGLIYFFGENVRDFLERRLGILMLLFLLMLVGGFIFLKWLP